jgi:hypothetical protein
VAALGARTGGLAAAAADALANVMLHNAASRLQLVATKFHVKGAPISVGRTSDTSTSVDANNQRQQQQLGGLHALTRLLHTPQVPLLVKALRALSNAVIGCPSNQAALVATGVIPALVKLCDPSLPHLITRQALGVLGNCVGGCAAAQQAALAAGVLQAAAAHLQPTTSDPAQGTGSKDESSVSTSNGMTGNSPAPGTSKQAAAAPAGASGSSEECAERACLLLANMCAAGPSARAAVVEAGVLPLLLRLAEQGAELAMSSPSPSGSLPVSTSTSDVTDSAAESQHKANGHHAKSSGEQEQQASQEAATSQQQMRAAVAAVNALGNLVLNAPSQQAAATQAGAASVLVHILRQAASEPDLVVGATHALGSLVCGCPGAAAQAVEAGVLPTLVAIIEVSRITVKLRPAWCMCLLAA